MIAKFSFERANSQTTAQYGSKLDVVAVCMADDGTITETVEIGPGRTYDINRHLLLVDAPAPPTEAQRATIARWYLTPWDRKTYSPAAYVCRWAFAGYTPDQISAEYGDGKKVLLAGRGAPHD